MDDETLRRVLEGLKRLPPPPTIHGFSMIDIVKVQPMTLPVLDTDLKFIEGPIPELREEDNICTLGRYPTVST